jgi:hypothetical protein
VKSYRHCDVDAGDKRRKVKQSLLAGFCCFWIPGSQAYCVAVKALIEIYTGEGRDLSREGRRHSKRKPFMAMRI